MMNPAWLGFVQHDEPLACPGIMKCDSIVFVNNDQTTIVRKAGDERKVPLDYWAWRTCRLRSKVPYTDGLLRSGVAENNREPLASGIKTDRNGQVAIFEIVSSCVAALRRLEHVDPPILGLTPRNREIPAVL